MCHQNISFQCTGCIRTDADLRSVAPPKNECYIIAHGALSVYNECYQYTELFCLKTRYRICLLTCKVFTCKVWCSKTNNAPSMCWGKRIRRYGKCVCRNRKHTALWQTGEQNKTASEESQSRITMTYRKIQSNITNYYVQENYHITIMYRKITILCVSCWWQAVLITVFVACLFIGSCSQDLWSSSHD